MRSLSLASLLALSWVACSPGASGGAVDSATPINAPFFQGFDGTGPLDGWLFYNPSTPNTPPAANVSTLWAVDGTPDDMPGGAFVPGRQDRSGPFGAAARQVRGIAPPGPGRHSQGARRRCRRDPPSVGIGRPCPTASRFRSRGGVRGCRSAGQRRLGQKPGRPGVPALKIWYHCVM